MNTKLLHASREEVSPAIQLAVLVMLYETQNPHLPADVQVQAPMKPVDVT